MKTLKDYRFFIEVGDNAICVYLVEDGYIDDEAIATHMWENYPIFAVNEILSYFGYEELEVPREMYQEPGPKDALGYIEKAIRARGGTITQTLNIRTPIPLPSQ